MQRDVTGKKQEKEIEIELLKLLYTQLRFGLWAESAAAMGLAAALWHAIGHITLISWLFCNLIFCGLARHILCYYYRRNTMNGSKISAPNFWLNLFIVGVIFSGISWGLTGSLLMVGDDAIRQTFTMFLLVGVVTAANPLYSPFPKVYLIFIFLALTPFGLWLINQDGVFTILSILAFVYLLLMTRLSFYTHDLLFKTFSLRFANKGLIDDLSIAKQELEVRTHALEKSLALGKAALESTTDGILVVTLQNKIEDYNQKFASMWRIPLSIMQRQDEKGMMDIMIDQLENADLFLEKINKLFLNPEDNSFDELYFKDSRVFEAYSYPQYIGNKCVGRVWSFRDTTSRKLMEEKLFQQANFDLLTGLPNRALAIDRLSQAIMLSKQTKTYVAAFFIDIDRFKLINDTLGHALGDKLLATVAERLLKHMDENVTISREGGDEFLIILHSTQNEAEAINFANKIFEAVHEPFLIDNHKLTITVSIGISFYPKDAQDSEILIRNADIAMYRAKELGRNNFQFFTEEMNKQVLTRLIMENKLRDAIKFDELYLVYQPIVSLKTGKIVSLEALLRWQTEKFVDVPIEEIIALAEETGLIFPIGSWVLANTCTQLNAWKKENLEPIRVAVNISPRQFRQENFLYQLRDIINEKKADPNSLIFEITENVIMDDIENAIKLIYKIKELGLLIMIDDFGIGYSSLNYLKRLPVDKVKIDRSFIRGIPYHADDCAITAAIIALASQLKIQVIAEGVETEEQLTFLLEHNCDEIQGYYFSRALDAETCTALLHEKKQLIFPVQFRK